jgi:hypothetical protein
MPPSVFQMGQWLVEEIERVSPPALGSPAPGFALQVLFLNDEVLSSNLARTVTRESGHTAATTRLRLEFATLALGA